ncbi:MAG: hypothetical protein LQ340_003813 [Diploschistes diacapsis]|nr:MAG: hypothetical protein LQ340_003813 [Diploschistes diacapsis]
MATNSTTKYEDSFLSPFVAQPKNENYFIDLTQVPAQRDASSIDKENLIISGANTLVRLARWVALTTRNPELARDVSGAFLSEFARKLTDADLEKARVPREFWSKLRNLRVAICELDRRPGAQYSEYHFAKLLATTYQGTQTCKSWGRVFPLVYGSTVEEFARRFDASVDFMKFREEA